MTLLACAVARAAAPELINFQGKLTDTGDVPVDGTVDIVFSIHELETGDALVWTETHTDVTVDNGLFTVLLGGTTPITPTVLQSGTCWLEMEVEGELMSPRQRMVSVAYAQVAAHAASADTATTATTAGDADTVDGIHASGTPAADTLLALDADSKLPADITGDADTLDTLHAADLALAVHTHVGGEVTSAVAAAVNADLLDGLDSSAFAPAGDHPHTGYVAKAGDTMAGDLSLGGNQITDVRVEAVAGEPEAAGAANEGRVYYNVTEKRLEYSDGTKWVPLATTAPPIIWSGGSSIERRAAGWNVYLTDVTEFDTAAGYLSVAADGTITVLIPGFYRISAYALRDVSAASYARIVRNGTVIYNTKRDSTTGWFPDTLDLTYQFDANDTIQVLYYAGSASDIAYSSWTATNTSSRLQVIYLGPQ